MNWIRWRLACELTTRWYDGAGVAARERGPTPAPSVEKRTFPGTLIGDSPRWRVVLVRWARRYGFRGRGMDMQVSVVKG